MKLVPFVLEEWLAKYRDSVAAPSRHEHGPEVDRGRAARADDGRRARRVRRRRARRIARRRAASRCAPRSRRCTARIAEEILVFNGGAEALAGAVLRRRRARRQRHRADAVVRAVRRGSDGARRRDAALRAAPRERLRARRRRDHAPRRRAHEADPRQHAAQPERRAGRRGAPSGRSTRSRSGAGFRSSSTRSITRSITARRRARPASTRARRVLGDFSKSFSLPGLRIGWLLERDAKRRRELENAHGYFTTSTGMLGELLAEVAARNRETILESRARRQRARILRCSTSGAREHEEQVEWLRPRGSMTAFPRLRGVADARPFCVAAAERGVLRRARRCVRRAGAFSHRLRARDAALPRGARHLERGARVAPIGSADKRRAAQGGP